jgi:hypothetical protein
VRPRPVREGDRVDCATCYGNGCASCSHRGWFESDEARADREQAEDDWADAERERRILDRD